MEEDEVKSLENALSEKLNKRDELQEQLNEINRDILKLMREWDQAKEKKSSSGN